VKKLLVQMTVGKDYPCKMTMCVYLLFRFIFIFYIVACISMLRL
jgi:hypothetical protein